MVSTFVVGLILSLSVALCDAKPMISNNLPLTMEELMCRMLSVYIEDYATWRDAGVSITEGLVRVRSWSIQTGKPLDVRLLHERLLVAVYHDSWLSPQQARTRFETGCVVNAHKEKK